MPSKKVTLSILLLLISSFVAFAQKYPEMIKVKSGMFLMGDLKKEYNDNKTKWVRSANGKFVSADTDGNYLENDGTLRQTLVTEFSISLQPVSVEQYRAYCYSMGFDMPKLPEGIKGTEPMINVSFEDAESYCRWLKRKTGKHYHLPTEAEWEYASRGANLNRPKGLETKPEVRYKEFVVDNDRIFKSNGSIWEWTYDTYADKNWEKYKPRIQRVVRKGTSGKKTPNEQPYHRKGIFQDSALLDVGFRVVQPGLFKTEPYLIVDKSAIEGRKN